MAIAERFGWTLDELDAQDASRLLPDLYADAVADSLRRVNAFLDSMGRVKPSHDDWANYSRAIRLMEAETKP